MKRMFDSPRNQSGQPDLLFNAQLFNAGRKNLFCFLASIRAHRDEGADFNPGRKLTAGKPSGHCFIKTAQRLRSFVQSANHFIRSELMSGDSSNGNLKFFNHVNSSNHAGFHEILILHSNTKNDLLANLRKLGVRPIQNGTDGISATQKCELIAIYQKLCRMLVLLVHDKNGHQQCRNRANRLNPTWPSLICQASVVANNRSSYRNTDKCDSKNYMGFLHGDIQSYLKGILA